MTWREAQYNGWSKPSWWWGRGWGKLLLAALWISHSCLLCRTPPLFHDMLQIGEICVWTCSIWFCVVHYKWCNYMKRISWVILIGLFANLLGQQRAGHSFKTTLFSIWLIPHKVFMSLKLCCPNQLATTICESSPPLPLLKVCHRPASDTVLWILWGRETSCAFNVPSDENSPYPFVVESAWTF